MSTCVGASEWTPTAPFARDRRTFRDILNEAMPNPWAGTNARFLSFRLLVVACQAATLLITWPLWKVHAAPPMVPALDLPQVDLGVALLVSLALVVIVPVPGAVIHVALLAYACAIDQTRLQPEVVSLALLLCGTLGNASILALARAHLVAMWFFAGFNKLLSSEFIHGTAQWMLSGLMHDPSPWLEEHVGYVIAGTEMAIGIFALLPATRRLAALAAIGLHAGILLDLSPRGHNWNQAVWPWNTALAFAGLAFIWPWTGGLTHWFRSCAPAVRPLLLGVLIAPFGFYVGITDAYLAHNLYSSNTADASVRCADDCLPYQQPSSTWDAFNVPLPPEHRIFRTYFEASCRPGDVMTISDSRWWYRRRDQDRMVVECPQAN